MSLSGTPKNRAKKMKAMQFIVIGLLIQFLTGCLVSAGEHEYRLTKYLLSNYEPSVRPVENSSEPLNVTFDMSIHHIIDVDEKNQVLTMNCWITQIWRDVHLTWNHSDFGGIKSLRLPFNKVWRPDIILYNNADSGYNQAIINTNVIVDYRGEVTWLSHGIFRSSCDISVEYFPFDIQNCSMKWASWTYDGKSLNIFALNFSGDPSNYQQNGEFNLENYTAVKHIVYYSCCPDAPFPDITYYIILRRRPMFYVFNLILPCVLINGIALLVFYVPSESGEKVTLGISALLSMTVFLMTIRESLPPTEKTPLISMYYGVSICLVSFASAMAVVTLNIHHRGLRGIEVPELVRRLVLGYLSKVVFLEFDEREEEDETQDNSFPHKKRPNAITLRLNEMCDFDAFADTTHAHPQMDGDHNPMTVMHTGINRQANQPHGQIFLNAQTGCTVTSPHNSLFVLSQNSMSCDSSTHPAGFNGFKANQGYLNKNRLNGEEDQQTSQHNSLNRNNQNTASSPSSLQKRTRSLSRGGSGDLPGYCATMGTEESWEPSLSNVLNKVSQTIDKNEKRAKESDQRDQFSLEWKQVSLVMDRFLLLVFFLAMTISSLVVLTSSPHLFSSSGEAKYDGRRSDNVVDGKT